MNKSTNRKTKTNGPIGRKTPKLAKPVKSKTQKSNSPIKRPESMFSRVDISKKRQDIGKVLYTNMSFPKIYNSDNSERVERENLEGIWMGGMLDYDKYKKVLEQKRIPPHLIMVKPHKKTRKEKLRELIEPIHPDSERKILSAVENQRLEELEQKYFIPQDNSINYTYIHELNNYRKEKELLDYKKRNEEPVISSKMDKLLKLTKKEEENAIKIQRYYRKVMRRRYYEFIKDKIPLVIKIQKVFRGYITRKIVRKYIVTRVFYVILIQSLIRRYLAIKRFNIMRQDEIKKIIKIQSVYRGYKCRMLGLFLYYNKCATKIQKIFRGYIIRSLKNEIMKDIKATKIEKIYRGFIQRKKYKILREKVEKNCLIVERIFRGHVFRENHNKLLFENEMREKELYINHLRSKISVIDILIDKTHILKSNLHYKTEHNEYNLKLMSIRSDIRVHEKSYLQNERELNKMGSSYLESGDIEKLNDDIRNERKIISKLKYNFLFEVSIEKKELEEKYKDYKNRMKKHMNEKECLMRILNEEIKGKEKRLKKYKENEEEMELKYKIGEEKRKWVIRKYRRNGKIDYNHRFGLKKEEKIESERSDNNNNCKEKVINYEEENVNMKLFSKFNKLIEPMLIDLDKEKYNMNGYEEVYDLSNVNKDGIVELTKVPKRKEYISKMPWDLLESLENEQNDI